jgi:predicted nucleic acid-binding protein
MQPCGRWQGAPCSLVSMSLVTLTARPPRCRQIAGSGFLSPAVPTDLEPPSLERAALFDTGVWTWARDRRFPRLATWFNAQVANGLVLVCDLVILELTRLTPNETRAREVTDRLAAFESVPMPATLWRRARELQIALAAGGEHRRVPPVDLLIACAAQAADVPLIHYDRDYERIGRVSALEHRWFLPDGTLAAQGASAT